MASKLAQNFIVVDRPVVDSVALPEGLCGRTLPGKQDAVGVVAVASPSLRCKKGTECAAHMAKVHGLPLFTHVDAMACIFSLSHCKGTANPSLAFPVQQSIT
jgi:hypothetical protein